MFQRMNDNSACWSSQNLRRSTTVSRLPLRDWLRDRANRGDGVSYCDGNKNLIKIPWVHASKKSWNQTEHCKLFEDWAIYTGKHNRDAKIYKANFRCALNSLSDVIEQTDHSKKNGHDGFRVFRIVDDPLQFKTRRASKKKLKARHSAKVTHQNRSNSFSVSFPPSPPVSPEGSESSFHNSCSSSSEYIKYSADDVIEECPEPLDFTDMTSFCSYDPCMADPLFDNIEGNEEVEDFIFSGIITTLNPADLCAHPVSFTPPTDVDDARIPTMVSEMEVDGDDVDVFEPKQRSSKKTRGTRPAANVGEHIKPPKMAIKRFKRKTN